MSRIKRSYLTNLGLKRKDVKRVSQKVELVLREINGIIEPVVFADVIYENTQQAVRFVAQFAALTGELVFIHDKLLLEKVRIASSLFSISHLDTILVSSDSGDTFPCVDERFLLSVKNKRNPLHHLCGS